MTTTNRVQIPDRLYFRIGDVAELLGVKPYVLRYWESEFPIIHPQKSPSGQRVYRRSDVETVLMIKHLLYEERYSIEGARKRIKELRKEGELKQFKVEALSPSDSIVTSPESSDSTVNSDLNHAQVDSPIVIESHSEVEVVSASEIQNTPIKEVAFQIEKQTRILEAAQELKGLLRIPLNELFRF